jgi:protein-tyrosine-phosphatase
MEEIGIDLSKHRCRTFEDLEDTNFDLIVSLSPEAQHRAIEMTRTMACDVEFWNTFDPTLVDGTRDAMLEAYRQVRDGLLAKVKQRFPLTRGPTV